MRFILLALVFLAAACGGGTKSPTERGTHAVMNLAADLTASEHFYDFPYPSDLRLNDAGEPELAGFPNPKNVVTVNDLLLASKTRKFFPVLPVAYFRFTAPIAKQSAENVIPAETTSPLLLVDVDEASPERGRLFPTVAMTLEEDIYAPANLLAVAARPGFILRPNTKYAFVVLRSLNDANGKPLGISAAIESLRGGHSPGGTRGAEAVALYAPLWETLAQIGVAKADVATATVFTTADVVQELYDISSALLKKHTVTITNLEVDPDDGAAHADYCELRAKVSYPQFQQDVPPFKKNVAESGLFKFDADGVPIKQRDEEALVSITLPKTAMPAGGYPLTVYFHGSGGYHNQVVDRGRILTADGEPTKGEGPSFVLAKHGFATAGSALPVNPERLPGADEIAYLNLDNVAAFRDTFRQGAIEQRMFLSALLELRISPATVASCTGLSLPGGETAYRFSAEKLAAMGQSMGGMYTNVIGSVEPRYRIVVPTGAGGYWGYFILKTSLIPGATALLGILLQTQAELSFLHPALHLLETAWEPAEPFVYMPRLARRPLEGHPVRPIYEPVGKDDSYFPTVLYDAVVLAYGHPMAGQEVWPTMQEALALDGLDGILPYPVTDNLTSESGTPYTGVVVQYEGDGIYDPHSIYGQLDAVKYQYGCFLKTFMDTGTAKVLSPAPLGTPCQ